MTVRTPAVFQQSGSYPAENVRQMIAAMARSGVVGASDLAVSANGTPNMSVNVAPGAAFVPGTEATYQGTYFLQNDAVVNLVVAASDPTNPRIDLVVARIRDAAYSGAINDASVAVITGTPAASPAAPAAPADSIVLAQIAVAANASSVVTGNITDLRASRGPVDNYQAATEPTASGSYVDLATVGPSVTLIVPGNKVKVSLFGRMSNNTVGAYAFMGFAVDGTLPADDSQAIGHALGSNGVALGATFLVSGFTPGTSHTFTAKYRVTGGTGTYLTRRILVEPI